MGHEPQRCHIWFNKKQETKATEISNLETHENDSVEAHKLRPATLTDSEHESESDVESDATNDTKDLPDTPSDIIYMISDEEGLGVTTHRSEGNP